MTIFAQESHEILSSLPVTLDKLNTSPVIKLKELYNSNPQFRNDIDEAFKNLQNMPADYAPRPNNNYWKMNNRANFDSLFMFFYKWSLFAPTTEDGLSAFIEPFYEFYYNNKPAIRVVTQFPGYEWTKYFLDWRKKYMDSPRSLWTVDDWKKDPSWNDYVIPKDGFKSFNELFTRKIKLGLRPIDEPHDPSILVSPSDSRLNKVENKLSEYDRITTKVRQKLSIKQLLDNSKFHSMFIDGSALSFVLMPNNYHHWHAPLSGIVVESRENVLGNYFGNPNFPDFFKNKNLGYNSDFSVFEVYRRGYYIFKTISYGYVAMITVGLDDVSSINFEPKFKDISEDNGIVVKKGDLMGHFAYGGSLIILLFQRNVLPIDTKISIDVLQGKKVAKLNPIIVNNMN